jgi:hypothetical protein
MIREVVDMKIFKYVTLIMIISGMNISCVSRKTIESKSVGFSSIEIKVDLECTQNLRKNIWGFNTSYLWDDASFDNPEFIKLYEDLGSPMARFPGGTQANWYDFKTDSLKCYPGQELYKRAIARTNSRLKRRGEKLDISSFAEMIKATKSPFLLVLIWRIPQMILKNI